MNHKTDDHCAAGAPLEAPRTPKVRLRTTDEIRALRLRTGMRAGTPPSECQDCDNFPGHG